MPASHFYQLFAVIYLMSVVILIIRNDIAVLLGTSDENNNICHAILFSALFSHQDSL